MSIIRFYNVYFSYDGKENVFENITFEVGIENGIVGVISDVGKGKSTFLRLMGGMLKPSHGTIVVLNFDIVKATKLDLITLHKRTAFVFQESFLLSNLSVYDNLALPLLYNFDLDLREIENRIDSVLDIFGFRDDKYSMPSELSLVEKKLISISRALIYRPRIIFLDQPFSYLDKYYSMKVIELFKEIAKDTLIIFSDVNDTILSQISDSIIYIEDKNKVYVS